MIKIKRPALICTMGALIGIIYGLYFKTSIVFIIGIFFIIYYFSIRRMKNIKRYLKVIIGKKVVVIFCLFSIISNTYLIYLNNKYEKLYNNIEESISLNAVVVSNIIEKEYTYSYIIKIREGKYKNKKFFLILKKCKDNILQYGDLINIDGEYIKPSKARNYKGFNYSSYLKSKKIYGTIKADKINVIKNNALNLILLKSNSVRNYIENQSKRLLPEKTSGLLIGILLGNKDGISEETIQNFRTSNLSHILAVSGAHTSYVIMRINLHFK